LPEYCETAIKQSRSLAAPQEGLSPVRRYFFHLKSPDGLEIDEIGLDLAGEDAAYKAALGVMAEIAGELMHEGRSPLECSFWITDDRGERVLEAPFPALLNGVRQLAAEPRTWRVATAPRFRSRAAIQELADQIFRRQFEAAPNAHLLLTPDLAIVAANERYRTMVGSQLEQLVGRDLFDAFPDNAEESGATDQRSITDSFQTALATGLPQVLSLVRYDVVGPDGIWRERYWRTEARPVQDENGSIIALDIEAAELTRHMSDLANWRRGRGR
jgi:PAS domain-containing protein